jgi:hypothetical protein
MTVTVTASQTVTANTTVIEEATIKIPTPEDPEAEANPTSLSNREESISSSTISASSTALIDLRIYSFTVPKSKVLLLRMN